MLVFIAYLFIFICFYDATAIIYKDQRFVKNEEIKSRIIDSSKHFCNSIKEPNLEVESSHILYSLITYESNKAAPNLLFPIKEISLSIPTINKLNNKFAGDISLTILPKKEINMNEAIEMLCNKNTFNTCDFKFHIHLFAKESPCLLPLIYHEIKNLDEDTPNHVHTIKIRDKEYPDADFCYFQFVEIFPDEKSLVRIIYE
jgi:hypothetical protein